MARKILRAILLLLAAGTIGFYVYEIVVIGVAPTDNLLRTIAVLASLLGAFLKTGTNSKRRSLAFYEKSYEEEIKGAFQDSPTDRKKLLKALRFYNENKLNKAGKLLIALQKQCKRQADYQSVSLFLALVFTDMGLYPEAINVYEQLLARGIQNSTLYSNLGSVYSAEGEYEKAISAYQRSLALSPDNAYAYNNLAKLYFDTYDFDHTIEYAQKALQINHKMYQAASALAIVYALRENSVESEKYFHIAIAGGQDPKDLRNAITFYKEQNDVHTK